MDKVTTDWFVKEFDNALERTKRELHPEEFPALPRVPGGRYTNEGFYQLEKDHLWSSSWLFAGHLDELPERGSYKLWRDSGAPIVLVRVGDNEVRGHYNTCMHRGGPLVREECGTTASFRCKYHSWNYDLDGKLKFIPDEYEFPAVNKAERGLKQVKVELWGRWIFVNRNDAAEPLSSYLGRVQELMADYRPEKMRLISKHSLHVKSNWKVVYDAFLEVYHVKFIHPKTADVVLKPRGFSNIMHKGGHSTMAIPNKDGLSPTLAREGLASDSAAVQNRPPPPPGLELIQKAAINHNIFPNINFVGSENLVPMIVVWPSDVNHSRMDVWWFGYDGFCDPDSDACRMARAAMDMLISEDIENLEWVQQSMESPALKDLTLGHHERLIYWHEEEIDRKLGAHNVPASLVVPQLMAPFVE